MEKMKAILCTKYGPPEVLHLKEVEKPIPKKNEVLIRNYATAVTASDCIIRGFNMPGDHKFPMKQIMELMMRLYVGFTKPKNPILGLVFSGEIELVGKEIKRFKKGDQVFGFTGYSFGTYAEYNCLSENESKRGCLGCKPNNMSHEDAASVSYGGMLAIHYMRKMNIQTGQRILIYGASGAIGTVAVQLAKSFGAQVTGVCGSSNAELVKSLGAEKVIDYTQEDATNKLEVYDYILDAAGKNKTSKLKIEAKKALGQNGKYVSVDDGLLELRSEYLIQLKELVESGHIRAVTDKTFPLEQGVEAHRYVDTGHKKGNVVITI
jgi:NADPH:quinone reductase-like Zn-dependent oxidoreductase